MSSDRPNPDELLARVQAEETKADRGKLKIFFGYVAGVGKTYAMLEAAQRERAAGVDVVVGYVEPHGRPETEALLHGLECLPARQVPYRGVNLREFDLDAALARRPALILVDELAHTNAEGSRHAKRWQDVEELLEAGCDVWSTLNVQHVESLNDVIAQITGIVVHETLPDSVLERADDIELVDLTPEELMDRLRAGKVYVPQQAERALQNFFQKANLVALRELSLRQAAQRLRRDVESARQEKAATSPWATSERLLVCVGPSPTTARLLRTAKRMAAAFGAEWLAVAVETRGQEEPAAIRAQIAQHLRLAEQLGAEARTLVGSKVAEAILDFARSRNVTKIVVGKTAVPPWKRLFLPTVVDQLLEKSGDIDVYVIRGEGDAPAPLAAPSPPQGVVWGHYLATGVVVGTCGLLGWLSHSLNLTEANIVMVFLLGVAFVAARYGRGPAIAASVASVLVFDFFFVPPRLTFTVNDAQYVLTFGVMLIIGIVISALTARVQAQLRGVQEQERRTAALYRLTKQLSEVAGPEFLVNHAGQQLREIFDAEVVLFLREGGGPLALRFGAAGSIAQHPVNAVVAHWVADHVRPAGLGTDTLPNATALFVPLIGSQRTIGAVGVRPVDVQRLLDPEQRRLLETCASLIALSLERDQSLLETHQVQLQVESERLRNALLSSVSHDLRTPLAAIAGASSALLDGGEALEAKTRRELLQSIIDESESLNRLVGNLLDTTRLEAGALKLNSEWQSVEELLGVVLARLGRQLADHLLQTNIPADLPLVRADGILLQQVLLNLLENAVKYAPAGTPITISARPSGRDLLVEVADRGPGLAAGEEKRVFEKFERSVRAGGRPGAGLGLTVCKGIIDLHGGRIWAENRPEGGAVFRFTLPIEAAPELSVASGPLTVQQTTDT